jgi:hypothetical protein
MSDLIFNEFFKSIGNLEKKFGLRFLWFSDKNPQQKYLPSADKYTFGMPYY